ncbi:hypothetical protein [Actinacidiphila sp. bgisy145]|uniref:hypothetical protein n=1 Tax=Actinacidiphila sp. bgisy145 TaxID=3413792 RepID=UPI003EBCF18B
MSDQPTERPAVIAAFDSLIDTLLANPVLAPLAHDGNWTVHSNSLGAFIRLLQHVHAADPQSVLDSVTATFGGKLVPDGPAGEGQVWHKATTHWQGAQLDFTLAAPGLSTEETLRARVAELEQQLAAQQLAAPTVVVPLTERPDPLESALLSAWNNSEPEMPECHRCGNPVGPWAPDPSGARWPSGAQKLVCQVGCNAGGAR